MQFPGVTSAFQSSNSPSQSISHLPSLPIVLGCNSLEWPSLSFWDVLLQTSSLLWKSFYDLFPPIAPNWSTCFKFLKYCKFPWVYWANIDSKIKSSQYDSTILDPSFPHVYLIESCPCQVCSYELLSDQGLLPLPLGCCRDPWVHCTYSWQLHSSHSHCLCSER